MDSDKEVVLISSRDSNKLAIIAELFFCLLFNNNIIPHAIKRITIKTIIFFILLSHFHIFTNNFVYSFVGLSGIINIGLLVQRIDVH